MTSLPLRRAERPLWLWGPVLGGIALWFAHITYLMVAAPFVCEHPRWRWTIHAATVVTAAPTLALALWCLALARAAVDGVGGRRLRFLGRFGFLVNVANLVLILAEEAFAIFLDPCRR